MKARRAKSTQVGRRERGIQGPRGRPGKTGRAGVAKTGPTGRDGTTGRTGETGETGKTGETGSTGSRGRVGRRGPAGTLAGSEHTEVLILQRRVEDIYEALTRQTHRTKETQLELENLRRALGKLLRGSN